jgi:hypothetical protein
MPAPAVDVGFADTTSTTGTAPSFSALAAAAAATPPSTTTTPTEPTKPAAAAKPEPTEVAATTNDAQPSEIEVSFSSTPPGAQVWVGPKGRAHRIGVTPMKRSFPTAERSLRVKFVLEGFNEPVRNVTLAPGASVNVKLRAGGGGDKKDGELINPF